MPNWLNKVRELLPARLKQSIGAIEATDDRAEDDLAPSGTASGPPASESWASIFRRAIPLAMLILGGLIAACTELVGLWAILGYLLLASAPIVYLLQRIEATLMEILKVKQQASRRRTPRPND